MTLTSAALRRAMRLPRPRTPRVAVDRDVAVPMLDGAVLRHDHHRPAGPAGPTRGPVVLVRSPYGRAGWVGAVFGRLVAERGWQVVVQSVRGTAGSEGVFSPFAEADDGVATAAWVVAQPWCDGRLATLGPSYLGLTQWALAPAAAPALRAMGTQVTASSFRGQTYAGGSFSLDNALSWSALIRAQAATGGFGRAARLAGRGRRVARAFAVLPLATADTAATGGEVDFFQEWLRETDAASPYWAGRSYTSGVGDVARAGVAVTMLGGWQDIFLPWQLEDHAALRAAGARPRLVVGPWVHASPAGMAAGLRESLASFERTFGASEATGGVGGASRAGEVSAATTEAAPITVILSGGGGRRHLTDWPPPARRERSWFLRTDHTLADEVAAHRGAAVPWQGTAVHYDPADPTPAVGGPILSGHAGPRDQARLEARADVAVFTSALLADDVVALGPAEATVYLRADAEHLDVFVRVCDVDPSGRSVNVVDGLTRLAPGAPARDADGSRRVTVTLWPAGHRFAAGHRLRVQVSGGAHPRFARHPGTGDPLGESTVLVPTSREVLHDPEHPSSISLSVEERQGE